MAEAEPLSAFTDDELRLPRVDHLIDSRPLSESVVGGLWRASDEFVRAAAESLRTKIVEHGGEVHYFGMAEVPHLLGIAAHLGDETLVHAHDYDRDQDTWAWPEASGSLVMKLEGVPKETVSQSGDASLVVEVSYPVQQHEVDDVIGTEATASIRIRPQDRDPTPGIVRAAEDVMAVRHAVREALGAIALYRPGTSVIHLFIAAPASACFAVGQELRLRNGKDVQTYRYRADDAEPQKRALLLTARALPGGARIVTEAESALAAELRAVVQQAHRDVKKHASELGEAGPWYRNLMPAPHVQAVRPFVSLSPLNAVVLDSDVVSDEPRDVDYGFEKEAKRTWKLSDALVLGFYEAAGRERERMRQLCRLFFYHEYLHDWQTLTKYTAEDVGSFANCLESIDYMADSFALLHQLDFAIRFDGVQADEDQKQFLADQIGLAIASFWAFEPAPPHFEWQERRLRRYLNWYWRRIQMQQSPDLPTALRTLVRRPAIEIVGFKYRTGDGRHYVLLNEPRPRDIQEVGVVLEDGRFMRRGTSTDLSVEEVMRAFGEQNRVAIDRFFNSLMEHAKQSGAVFAAPHTEVKEPS